MRRHLVAMLGDAFALPLFLYAFSYSCRSSFSSSSLVLTTYHTIPSESFAQEEDDERKRGGFSHLKLDLHSHNAHAYCYHSHYCPHEEEQTAAA